MLFRSIRHKVISGGTILINILHSSETLAKVTSGATEDSDTEVTSASTLRKRTSRLLADEDKKYAGKTVSG